MITGTVLMRRKNQKIVASTRYWFVDISNDDLVACQSFFEKSAKQSGSAPVVQLRLRGTEYFICSCETKFLLLFVADGAAEREDIAGQLQKACRAVASFIKSKTLAELKKSYARIMSRFVYFHLRVALIGDAGVGKTSALCLLMGMPPPKEYHPTVSMSTELIEKVRFANYVLMVYDFAGQTQSKRFWSFEGIDILLLLTDSTIKSILGVKDLLVSIHEKEPEAVVVVIANKQDLPNALDSSIIGRIVGVDVYPLVAIDLTYRDELLLVLLRAAARRFNIVMPDVTPEDLLQLMNEDQSQLIRE